jgi:hypothetical protein
VDVVAVWFDGGFTSLTEKVRANVLGAPEDESPSGSVSPTRRALGYWRSLEALVRPQLYV